MEFGIGKALSVTLPQDSLASAAFCTAECHSNGACGQAAAEVSATSASAACATAF